MMMKRFLCLLVIILSTSFRLLSKSYDVISPDGTLSAKIHVGNSIAVEVSIDGKTVLCCDSISMVLENTVLGDAPCIVDQTVRKHCREFSPHVAYKYETIRDECNVLVLDFVKDWSLEFRIYDDGFAYRFRTEDDSRMEVYDETAVYGFPEGSMAVMQCAGGYETPYEEPYSVLMVKDMSGYAVLPLLVDAGGGYKVLISEADLADYPCMFMRSDGHGGFRTAFPKVPVAGEEAGDRYVRITEEADYIAETSGHRTFPWRYFVITRNDGQLVENTMTARLAGESEVKDMSWIKPGQVSWEFWNAASVFGQDVDFVSGVNTETYKYYIDFASRFGIPYIIMDEGWAKDTRDPYTPSPSVDLDELIRYGNSKGVGIILWMTWLTVDRHMEMFRILSEKGIKGLKIDFMNRSDQYMVNYYERVAAEAAKYRMFISFHGSFKPSGLEYRYPNVLTYEGVRGMENMGGCLPSNSVWLPFIRNAVGPMDYTPGAMISMQPESYCGNRPNAAGIGTRAYQMALYIIFESGLQMLADSPSFYYMNRECTDFISGMPVTWDETAALSCKAGEYAVVAKRKGDIWYIGAMNGTDSPLDINVSLDFLDKTGSWSMLSFEDGPNAFRQAMDYRKKERTVSHSDKITINMARNGGWAAIIQ